MARTRPKKRTRLKPDVRRAQLLDVGLEVFAVEGPDATNLEDVAAAAGVTKPVVYHYFENKQAFFDSIAEREMNRVAKLVAEAALGATTFDDALRRTSRALFAYIEERPHGFGALLSHAPIAWQGDDRLSELRSTFYEGVVSAVQAAVRGPAGSCFDAGLVGHALVGAFIFAAQHWLADDSDTPHEEAADQLATLLLGGTTAIFDPE